MAGFFSPDNWYWKPFSYVGDAVLLSGMWLITSLPVVTAGAATTALYDCVAHCVRGGERDLFSRYFGTFKRELVPAMISFFLWALVLFGINRGIRGISGLLPDTNQGVMAVAALLFLQTVVVGIFAWVLPLLSRFTFSVVDLNRMAVRMALGHIVRTMAAGVVTMGAFLLCRRTGFAFMIAPEIVAVIWAALMEPVFKQYMTEEERMAVEKPKEDQEDPL